MRFFKKLWTAIKLSFTYLKVMPQLIRGAWKIGWLPQPVVSVFGGSRLKKNSKYVKWARELSERLVAYEISVITGGGPGIMEAANCGAVRKEEKHQHTMGIGVRGLTAEGLPNSCVKEFLITDYFDIRKFLLIHYSYAYVIFPGGFGTVDEFTQVITLMQTDKLSIAPVILIGTEFWSSFVDWIERAIKEGLIPREHAEYITITDDLAKATAILVNYCENCATIKHKK